MGLMRLVKNWFAQAEQASGPVLPDGWFGGRPYENLFILEDVELLGDCFTIYLSEDTRLIFNKLRRCYVEESELVLENFEDVTLRWKEYGGTQYRERRYSSGQVRLIPPAGTEISLSSSCWESR